MNRHTWKKFLSPMGGFLFVLLFAVTLFHVTGFANVKTEANNGLKTIVKPGDATPVVVGPPTVLNDGVVIFTFRLEDVDPLADDNSAVTITCFHIKNLGTALPADIVEILVLDGTGNSVTAASTAAAAPAGAPASATCPAGAPAGGAISFEAFLEPAGPGNFVIGDTDIENSVIGSETFQVAVRTAATGVLTDGSQNHTLALSVSIQFSEDVGSPAVTTTFTDSVTDPTPDVVFNGGINRLEEFNIATNSIGVGGIGPVVRFQVCDDDSKDDLVITDLVLLSGPRSTALSSDILNFNLMHVTGGGLVSLGTTIPTTDFNPGGTGHTFTLGVAFTVSTNTCETFELHAEIAPSAQRGRSLQVIVRFLVEEPVTNDIDASVEPTLRSDNVLFIGNGILQIPDTSVAGSSFPIQIKSFPEALGGLEVQTSPIKFDPAVIQVDSISSVFPYQINSSDIDNRLGRLRFSLTLDPAQSLSAKMDGQIATVNFTIKGAPGQDTPVVFQVDRVTDINGLILTGGVVVISGKISILSPGDVDQDNNTTVKDALTIAQAILSCTSLGVIDPALTDEQKKAGDVAPPKAAAGAVPTCAELNSADVREIARLALTVGIDNPITASVPSQAKMSWWDRLIQDLFGTPANLAEVSLDLSENEWRINVDARQAVAGVQGSIRFNPNHTQVQSVYGLHGHELVAVEIDHDNGVIRFVTLNQQPGNTSEAVLGIALANNNTAAYPQLQLTHLVDADANNIQFKMIQSQLTPVPLSVDSVQLATQSDLNWQLQVAGRGIGSVEITGFDLSGQRRFSAQSDDSSLQWQMLDGQGRPLANGVYLYVVTVHGTSGETWRSEVKKLALLR